MSKERATGNRGDDRARRIALRIVLVMSAVVAVVCVGGVLLYQSTFGAVQERMLALDAMVRERFPPGTTWQLMEASATQEGVPPTDEVDIVLAVGLAEDVDDGARAELRARLWNAYCEAFAEGGVHVATVAAGRAGRTVGGGEETCMGHVFGWADGREAAADVAARTGRTAPPDMALARIFGAGAETQEDG